MKEFAVFLMFIGMLVIVHSIYAEKLEEIKRGPSTKYKFIPRSELYDQYYEYDKYHRALFEDTSI